jgi:hypothetical protein
MNSNNISFFLEQDIENAFSEYWYPIRNVYQIKYNINRANYTQTVLYKNSRDEKTKSRYIIPCTLKRDYVCNLNVYDMSGNKLYLVPISEALPVLRTYFVNTLNNILNRNPELVVLIENKYSGKMVEIISYACEFSSICSAADVKKINDSIAEILSDCYHYISIEDDKKGISRLFDNIVTAVNNYVPFIKVPDDVNDNFEITIYYETSVDKNPIIMAFGGFMGDTICEIETMPFYHCSNTFVIENTDGFVIKNYLISNVIGKGTKFEKRYASYRTRHSMIRDNVLTLYFDKYDSEILFHEKNIVTINSSLAHNLINLNKLSIMTKLLGYLLCLQCFMKVLQEHCYNT